MLYDCRYNVASHLIIQLPWTPACILSNQEPTSTSPSINAFIRHFVQCETSNCYIRFKFKFCHHEILVGFSSSNTFHVKKDASLYPWSGATATNEDWNSPQVCTDLKKKNCELFRAFMQRLSICMTHCRHK